MTWQPQLTRGDRARRRERIIAAWEAAPKADDIAGRFGVSVYYVRQIARENGLSRRAKR